MITRGTGLCRSRRLVIASVLSMMRGLILVLSFCFPLVPPAVAGGPVERMLVFFESLRQAGREQAAHRAAPHVEARFADGEVNEYLAYALRTAPRPGVRSIRIDFADGNYIATT